ncbi:DUF4870 domain-containing protein [Herbiconiux sp. L3-i23]|uniref:DUF4870 domain-containing protein n=1 Tax=Herbiconiux sp. L3-i23 TaxID=2905871 RepID=UPI0020597C0D|nr:DUF4870 domain-containing protein [Herbiconiux sp. L3-i23]BDI23075.1 hypothetical protein L3i23_18510 [Herbiconiux sp. L3-i23]
MTDSSLPPSDPAGAPGQPGQSGQPSQPYAPAPAPAAPLSAADDKLWASLSHFGGVLGILPSLIIFLVLKDRGPLVRQESKEALNWQITFTIGMIALWIVVGILQAVLYFTPVWFLSAIIGLVPWVLYVANLVFSILGGVNVQQGGSYRYPFALRLVK